VAALALFVAVSLARHHGDSVADPAAALATLFHADSYHVTPPKTVLWGVPAVAVTMPDCPDPITAIAFKFDDIAIPGVLKGVLADQSGIPQIVYAGRTFPEFDRGTLFALRIANGAAALLRTGRTVDPPVIMLFWPRNCTPRPIS
jgi:hypothetical protein